MSLNKPPHTECMRHKVAVPRGVERSFIHLLSYQLTQKGFRNTRQS